MLPIIENKRKIHPSFMFYDGVYVCRVSLLQRYTLQ